MASSVASQNLHSVFVYGTLMADDVVRTQTRPLLLPCRSQRFDKPEKLFADVYFWADKNDPNLYGEWDFEEWEQLRMKELLTMTRDFIHESEQSETKSRVATYESHYGHDQLMI